VYKLNKMSTKTSSFGTNGRINHDSSDFYNSKLYNEFIKENNQIVNYVENLIDKEK